MTIRVGVVGASGFLGSEFVRLALGHPHLKVTALAGASTAGKSLGDVRPQFAGLDLPVIKAPDPAELAANCDAVILAMPHGESAPLAADLLAAGATVIDLGSDFRLRDPADVQTYYGREAPSADVLARAIYCLPELTGRPPAGSKLIASPGCFATGLALLLNAFPGSPDRPTPVFGVTGSSGSGVSPSAGVHHSLRVTNFTAYKALSHQHVGEVSQVLRDLGRHPQFQFVPHSLPAVRGIHLTAIVPGSAEQAVARMRDLYDHCPLVHVQSGPVAMGAAVGTCRVLMGAAGQAEETAVFVALDNLLKGGAGQALQSLNLLLGWPETLGLPLAAPWP
jgi:N-acetyl-gamma-glutamyl-phosphate reductase